MEEIKSANIDQGAMLSILDQQIARVSAAVTQSWYQNGEAKIAKGSVTLTIDIQKDEKYDDYCLIAHHVAIKLPAEPKRNPTLAKIEAHKLVCNESGSGKYDPEQRELFAKTEREEDVRRKE